MFPNHWDILMIVESKNMPTKCDEGIVTCLNVNCWFIIEQLQNQLIWLVAMHNSRMGLIIMAQLALIEMPSSHFVGIFFDSTIIRMSQWLGNICVICIFSLKIVHSNVYQTCCGANCFDIYSVFEIRLTRKVKNSNIYIDSIEKIWQKSLVRINFHWPWVTGPLLKSMTVFFVSLPSLPLNY
jgi:hypothetical protein